MNARVVYEIAHYNGLAADSVLLQRLQLITEHGSLRLRDDDGNEIPCKTDDIASEIAATPALRTVASRQEAGITCGEDILGLLPGLLEPVADGSSLLVNGQDWDAFPTVDGGTVMLPGYCDYDCAPEMNPCWAEYRCAEGGRSFEAQLVGFSSIGLLAPGVAIEQGRTDYGGNGGAAAVSVSSFDDFAATFIDWLLNAPILRALWQGDRGITSPDLDLFTEAVVDTRHSGYWQEAEDNSDDGGHGDDDDVDEDEDGYAEDEGSFASRSLELHLPQELLDEVRERLRTMYPKSAALDLPASTPDQN